MNSLCHGEASSHLGCSGGGGVVMEHAQVMAVIQDEMSTHKEKSVSPYGILGSTKSMQLVDKSEILHIHLAKLQSKAFSVCFQSLNKPSASF